MNTSQRFSAFIAYLLPVIGWLYVGLFRRKDPYAMFHLRQAISLVLFLIAVFLGWAVIAYVLTIIPYAVILGVAIFTIVMLAFFCGVVIWIVGMINALKGRIALLPIIGSWGQRLPV